MPPVQDDVSGVFAAITARLAAPHDGLTILRAVTDACRSLLGADAAGVLIRDPRGGIEVLTASDERAWFVELLQAQSREGPCLECLNGNTAIVLRDVGSAPVRWSHVASAMSEAGFRAVHAFPLRLAAHAVGGLTVFHAAPLSLSPAQHRIGQSLADLAVLGLTQERDQRRAERLAEQTLTALNDRVHVGHAVGMIAGSLGITPDAARARLSAHSTSTGAPLRDVSEAITSGALTPAALAASEYAGATKGVRTTTDPRRPAPRQGYSLTRGRITRRPVD